MGSNHATNPVKLFIDVLTMEDVRLEERLEERLISEYGQSDHRMILIPSHRTIHRVFFSFDRLIELGTLPKIRELSQSMEMEFSSKMAVGFVDNRRVAVGHTPESDADEEIIQFKNGGILILPRAHPDYRTDNSQEFFRAMRKSFRAQLRSVCRLRRSSSDSGMPAQ
jgi:hypothetical protein